MSPRTFEEEPAVSDYRRSPSRYEADEDGDRELTLSTPAVLGLFLTLVLVCGCFFGLGYAMGHKTTQPEPQVFDTTTAPAIGAAKPAAGSATAPEADSGQASTAPDGTGAEAQTATVPLSSAAGASGAATAGVPETSAAKPAAVQPAVAVAPGSFVVQVAAVSSQDVANILLSTLEKKGYAVVVRQEPQDKLLHVQIGPFSNRKDAEAMRQRVLADGFNAIVK